MSLPDRFRPVAMQPPVAYAAPPVYVPSQGNESDFFDTMRKIWRHRGSIIICTLFFTVIAVLVARQIPSHYIANARVLVGVPVARALNIEAIIADISPDAERIQNEAYVIQSRDVARQVIDRLKLSENPEFNPALRPEPDWMSYLDPMRYLPDAVRAYMPGQKAAALQGAVSPEVRAEQNLNAIIDTLLAKLDVTTLGRSHVLNIEARSVAPDTAAAIANGFSEVYLARQRSDKVEAGEEVEKFLTDRIATLREQVEKSDQAVESYRRENNLYQGASVGVTAQQLTELNTQLIVAQTAKAETDARLGEAQALRRSGVDNQSVPQVLQSPLVQQLKGQQAEAERRLADLTSNLGPQHPRVVSTKAEINDIRSKVNTEVGRIIESLRHEARTTTARYEALRQNFNRLQGQAGGVNEKSIRLNALEREATVNRNLLEQMMSRAKETIGQEQLQKPNAKLISAAAPPSRPGFPPKTLLVFLGSVAGMLIGMAYALLREGVDRTFRRSDQIESMTGLPVLAMVPTLRGSMTPIAHVLRKPVSPYSEALRKLHIGLELSEAAQSPKTVLFGSAVPGEGKSVLVGSLGRMLASHGRRILIIDCDWRNPRLHKLFQCQNRNGLAELLCDQPQSVDDCIFTDTLSGVDIIPAGVFSPQAMRYLTTDRMKMILQALAPRYDMIMLDTAPVLVGAEVLTLSRMVDKVAFMVRWGDTKRDAVMEALKDLIEVQADIAGVVMTRVDPKGYRKYGYSELNYDYERPVLVKPADWS
ncbi:polysaccharide biosynthesis tyrosine autokinase [Ferrovibrio terrae]|uniref:GumC family protein n=1 Tax=Ferrovibrio terrae TaxID=2594003 RepID=UPI003137D8E3